MPKSQIYWREIDGKYLINYRITALAIPFMVLSAPLQEIRPKAKGTFLEWTIASSIAVGVVAFLYFLSDITIFRNRTQKKYPIAVAISFGAFLGLLKGFLTSFAALKMSLIENNNFEPIYARSLSGFFIGAMTVPLVAFLLASIGDYAHERRRLIDDYLILEDQVRGDSEALNELKSQFSTKVDENLTKSLLKAHQQIKSEQKLEGQWQKIADTLRSAAEETVRPLSHAMWNVRQKEMQLTPSEFLRFAIQNIQIRPVAVIPIYIATTIMAVQNDGDIWKSLRILLLKGIMAWVLMEVGQIFLELVRDKFKYSLTIILTLIGIAYFELNELIYEASNYRTSSVDIIESIWLIILIFITGIADSALRTQIYQIRTLKGLIAKKRIELISNGRELDRLGREMARYLHGTIQSKLMAAAMAVEIAGRKNDKKQLDLEVEKALNTLQMPTQEYFDARIAHLNEGLEDLSQKWDGIIKLSYKISDKDVFSNAETNTIIDIANEAILNSYRHGQATSVALQIKRLSSNAIQMKVTDNGIGVQSMKPGLGSQYFNSLTRNWSLDNQRNSKGAVLTIEF